MRIRRSIFGIASALLATAAKAGPTQDEVFGSIREHVGDSGGQSGMVLLLIFAGCIVMALLIYFSRRDRREAVASAFNHRGKLLKEIARETGLKPAELKQLKALAQKLEERHEITLKSPLTLLLCPSLLAKAMQNNAKR